MKHCSRAYIMVATVLYHHWHAHSRDLHPLQPFALARRFTSLAPLLSSMYMGISMCGTHRFHLVRASTHGSGGGRKYRTKIVHGPQYKSQSQRRARGHKLALEKQKRCVCAVATVGGSNLGGHGESMAMRPLLMNESL